MNWNYEEEIKEMERVSREYYPDPHHFMHRNAICLGWLKKALENAYNHINMLEELNANLSALSESK
jgi:hypothetical protein